MAPVEPWERVWIDADTYAQDIHSLINCTTCHLGQSVVDSADLSGTDLSDTEKMHIAHEGMVDSPTEDAERTCGQCHSTITESAVNSLHNTLAGYDEVLHERSIPDHHAAIEEAEQYHCNSCHATCGDCHISQPSNVGGGLLDSHVFVEEPSMSRNCTACHGSRVKDEYYGAHEGLSSDVHFRQRMSCVDCHTGDEMHGVGVDANHRYDGPAEPSCESCHEEQVGVGSGILQHEIHGTETLSCQSCHSVSYTNCTNCHVERNEDDIPFYSVESHDIDFAIARNDLRSADRPYDYVTVRHVPIDRDSLSFYGVTFPNFDERPTWAYATPHNIQRNTPQTESCLSCHGNDDIFLTADKVVDDEEAANASIMLDVAPPLPDGYENVITGQEDQTPATTDGDTGDSFWGGGETSDETGDDDTGGFWGADDTSSSDADTGDAGSFWGSDANDSTGSESETQTDTQTSQSDDAGSFWGADPNATSNDDASDDSTTDDAGAFWGAESPAEEPTAVPDADNFWGASSD